MNDPIRQGPERAARHALAHARRRIPSLVLRARVLAAAVFAVVLATGPAPTRAQSATFTPAAPAPAAATASAPVAAPAPAGAQAPVQATPPTAAPVPAPGGVAPKSVGGSGSQPAASASPAAPVAAAAKPQAALTPVEARLTDQAIRGDLAFIRGYQNRLKQLNDGGSNPFSAYHYAKAVHWIDFALDEYQMKNRTGVIEQALDEGVQLINGLEQKRADLPASTRLIPLAARVRDDLWAAAEKMKGDKDGFKCAGGDIGRMEVQLVWAGHIQKDWGWRSAKPHLQAAERYYRDAAAGAETCPRPVAAAPAAVPAPKPDPAAAKRAADDAALAKLPPAKQIEILADRVHFAYDRANISVATAPILDRVASLLRGNKAINVTIEGHADERGSADYNLKLSQRRADAVRAYLMAAGVEAARLKTEAMGKTKPEVKAENVEGHAQNRRVVFVPSTQDLQINRQREDLQLRGDPADGKKADARKLERK